MEYVFLIALGWFIQEFEPFTLVAQWINEKTGKRPLLEYFLDIVTCWQCSTFWGSLIYTGSLKSAILASFFVFVIEMIYETWSRKK